MKILLIPFVFIFFQQFGFLNKKETPPPGTVMVRKNFYVDITEVKNADYLEFLFWMKRKHGFHSTEYKSALPDTNFFIIFKPHQHLYLRDKLYRLFPVVGISYEQANSFCKWRTDMVNASIYAKEKNFTFKAMDTLDMKLVKKIYEYRLPTKAEWENIASIDYNKKIKTKIEKEKIVNGNFYDPERTKRNDVKTFTSQSSSYFPNNIGVYDIFGNVAEIIAEKGIAKGGSWKTDGNDCSAQKDYPYDKPNNQLGFRCVCDKLIIENK